MRLSFTPSLPRENTFLVRRKNHRTHWQNPRRQTCKKTVAAAPIIQEPRGSFSTQSTVVTSTGITMNTMSFHTLLKSIATQHGFQPSDSCVQKTVERMRAGWSYSLIVRRVVASADTFVTRPDKLLPKVSQLLSPFSIARLRCITQNLHKLNQTARFHVVLEPGMYKVAWFRVHETPIPALRSAPQEKPDNHTVIDSVPQRFEDQSHIPKSFRQPTLPRLFFTEARPLFPVY